MVVEGPHDAGYSQVGIHCGEVGVHRARGSEMKPHGIAEE